MAGWAGPGWWLGVCLFWSPCGKILRLQELGWRVLIVWECALRGREKLTDEALSERLEEWICGEGASAQIDTQGIHLLA